MAAATPEQIALKKRILEVSVPRLRRARA